jgi:tight adherence protein C
MPLLVAILAGLSVTLLMTATLQLSFGQDRAVSREVAKLQDAGPLPFDLRARRIRRERRQQLRKAFQSLGERMEGRQGELDGIRRRLVQAGYWDSDAVRYYLAARIVLPSVLAGTALLVGGLMGGRLAVLLFTAAWLGALGWILPQWYIAKRGSRRWKEVYLALPDTLDLLVACVEAGMGLNQALTRVAKEVRLVSPVTTEELAMVNLEIRAGTTRARALKNLGDRSGLPDLKSLVSMLAQSDRFGTSVAQSLRVHVESLRTKRRQAAEEAAAKTTIKLVFPLVFCVFPSLFVVILTPAVIQVVEQLLEIS